jgi:hypothetical protein
VCVYIYIYIYIYMYIYICVCACMYACVVDLHHIMAKCGEHDAKLRRVCVCVHVCMHA